MSDRKYLAVEEVEQVLGQQAATGSLDVAAPPHNEPLLGLLRVVLGKAQVERGLELVPEDNGLGAASEEGVHLVVLDDARLDELEHGRCRRPREELGGPHFLDEVPQRLAPWRIRFESVLLFEDDDRVDLLPEMVAFDVLGQLGVGGILEQLERRGAGEGEER